MKELGYEVDAFKLQLGPSGGILERLKIKYQPRVLLHGLNRRLLKTAESYDIILLYSAFSVFPETVQKLKQMGKWIHLYTNDDPFGQFARSSPIWRNLVRYMHFADSAHGFRTKNVKEYSSLGIRHVGLLMSFYIKELHRPLRIDKKRDVSFIGHAEPDDRFQLLQALFDAGIEVKVFGQTKVWGVFAPKRLQDRLGEIVPLYDEDYVKGLCASRLNLCFLSAQNSDDYTQRVFEITACRGVLVAPYTDMLASLFKEDEEAIYFRDASDLIRKVKYYLLHDAEREALAERGHQRCLSDGHDAGDRARQLYGDLCEWYEQAARAKGR